MDVTYTACRKVAPVFKTLSRREAGQETKRSHQTDQELERGHCEEPARLARPQLSTNEDESVADSEE